MSVLKNASFLKKISSINNRKSGWCEERKHGINIDAGEYDVLKDGKVIIKLWNEIKDFHNKNPNIEIWDDAITVKLEWGDFNNKENKKRMIYFKHQVDGNISVSYKMAIEELGKSAVDLVSRLKQLEKDMSNFNGTPNDDRSAFINDFKLIEYRNFFSWHFLSLCLMTRINWVNGAWQEFLDIIDSVIGHNTVNIQNLRQKVCTERNYVDFTKTFDFALSDLANRTTLPEVDNFKIKMKYMWHSVWYFWAYADDRNITINTFKKSTSIKDWQEIEDRVRENSKLTFFSFN